MYFIALCVKMQGAFLFANRASRCIFKNYIFGKD